jgi:hypothetical protein
MARTDCTRHHWRSHLLIPYKSSIYFCILSPETYFLLARLKVQPYISEFEVLDGIRTGTILPSASRGDTRILTNMASRKKQPCWLGTILWRSNCLVICLYWSRSKVSRRKENETPLTCTPAVIEPSFKIIVSQVVIETSLDHSMLSTLYRSKSIDAMKLLLDRFKSRVDQSSELAFFGMKALSCARKRRRIVYTRGRPTQKKFISYTFM